jgi:hypothetical protein
VTRAVEHDEHPPARPGDPAQLAQRRSRIGDVVQHVGRQCENGGSVRQRQRSRVGDGQHGRDGGRSRGRAGDGTGRGADGTGRAGDEAGQPLAGGGEHARGQVQADGRAQAATGQLGQVHAVAAADVGHRAGRHRARQVEHPGGQVDARVLVGVDRLAGGQVGVGLVLGAAQVRGVSPRIGHPGAGRAQAAGPADPPAGS